MSQDAPFQRILLKLSGEILTATENQENPLFEVGSSIKRLIEKDVEVAIVIGGGNIFRGRDAYKLNMDRSSADHAGLLATMINGIFIKQVLSNLGVDSEVLSALFMPQIFEQYDVQKAKRYLSEKKVVILVAGIGTPYFSTDTAAVLRALEIGAEVILKGTKVSGIFNKDPKINPDQQKLDQVSCSMILQNRLNCMDMTAAALAREQSLPMIVFDLFEEGAIEKAALNIPIGTYVEGN